MVTAQVLGLRPRFEVVKLGLIVWSSRGLFPTNGLGAGSQASGWTQAHCKCSGTLTIRLAPPWPRPQPPDKRKTEGHLIVSVT